MNEICFVINIDVYNHKSNYTQIHNKKVNMKKVWIFFILIEINLFLIDLQDR